MKWIKVSLGILIISAVSYFCYKGYEYKINQDTDFELNQIWNWKNGKILSNKITKRYKVVLKNEFGYILMCEIDDSNNCIYQFEEDEGLLIRTITQNKGRE